MHAKSHRTDQYRRIGRDADVGPGTGKYSSCRYRAILSGACTLCLLLHPPMTDFDQVLYSAVRSRCRGTESELVVPLGVYIYASLEDLEMLVDEAGC